MALQDDSWRLHSVLKATAKQDHPFSRFQTGSEQTLLEKAGGVDGLHSELKKWNRAYYNSANMRLAVVGRESLEELEALVTASGRFGAIPSGELPSRELGPAWTSDETQTRVGCLQSEIYDPCNYCSLYRLAKHYERVKATSSPILRY